MSSSPSSSPLRTRSSPSSSPSSNTMTTRVEGGGIPFPTSDSPSPSPSQPTRSTRPFYAPASTKPFARSAAKRQSVTELPSIAHLQHQFLKAGLTSSSSAGGVAPSSKPAAHVTPVRLPHIVSLRSQPKGGEDWTFPPSPAVPMVDKRMPWEKQSDKGRSVKGEKELRAEVWLALEKVCQRWNLVAPLSTESHTPLPPSSSSPTPSSTPSSPTSSSKIPDLLATTTLAIRAVQNYVVSLPPEALFLPGHTHPRNLSTGSSSSSSSVDLSSAPPTPEKDTYVSGSTSSGSPIASTSTSKPLPISPARKPLPNLPSTAAKDGLQTLRRVATDVLQCLEDVESRYRVDTLPTEVPLTEEPEEDEELEAEPSLTHSVSTASASTLSNLSTGMSREIKWRELGDVRIDLGEERRVVRGWVNLVDKILLRTVAGQAERLGEGGRVPLWALEICEGEGLGPRVVESFLEDYLSPEMKARLTEEDEASFLSNDESNEEDIYDRLLEKLSDGQLLCLAYNKSLRSSSRPFGFIPKDQIWDLSLPLVPSSPPPSTSTNTSPSLLRSLSPTPTPISTRPVSSLGQSDSTTTSSSSNLGLLFTPPRPTSSLGMSSSSVSMRRDLSTSSSSSGFSDTTVATSVAMSKGDSEISRRESYGGTSVGEKERVGLTFRRIENLKIWAGALKFRYLLNPVSGFDPKLVGRREGEWKDGLKGMIELWVSAVGREWREERGL